MGRPGCERAWEIDPYCQGRMSEVEYASFGRHLSTCEPCQTQMALDAELRDLGQRLSAEEAGDLRARRLRAKILHDAAIADGDRPTFFHRRPAIALVAVLAGFLAVLLARPWLSRRWQGRPDGDTVVADVRVDATPEAVWARRPDGLIDRLKLERGEIAVRVKLLVPGSRFLVDLPDGELEVRGTTFRTIVVDGSTRGVVVTEGKVDLRLRGRPSIVVDPEHPWSRSPFTPPSGEETVPLEAKAPEHLDTGPPPSAPGKVSRRGLTSQEVDDEQPYAEAMASYESGHFEQAAQAFHDFCARVRTAPEREDAAFLEAASLARAGHQESAGRVAEDFLRQYPASIHGKQAAVLVSRAARARGDCARARAVLAPWIGTPRDSVIERALGSCHESLHLPVP
jgi:hypothetical protein